jgi:hypothetical protein
MSHLDKASQDEDSVSLPFLTSGFGVGAWHSDLEEDGGAACFSLMFLRISLYRFFRELLSIKCHAIHHTKIPKIIPIPGKRVTPKIMKPSPTTNMGIARLKPSNLFVIIYVTFFMSISSHPLLISHFQGR